MHATRPRSALFLGHCNRQVQNNAYTPVPLILIVLGLITMAAGAVGCSEAGNAKGNMQPHASSTAPLSVESRRGMPSTDSAPAAISKSASDDGHDAAFNRDAFDHIEETGFVNALSNPQSTFAVDVDTASFSIVRRFIEGGSMPPKSAVRIEELINYFQYRYPEPKGPHPFSVTTRIADCPWQPEHKLVQVGLRGKSINDEERPPCNLVFLLDVSGSMSSPDKLPLVQSAAKMLVEQMRPDDHLAIAVYAGASGLALPSTPGRQASTILAAIDELQAGGSTNGEAGIRLAYSEARKHFAKNGVNRVILCTDGDFNVGVTSQSELVELIESEAKSGVFLSVLGFGRGNLNDSTMEKLADHGNGNYAYIDSALEARKVLVEQAGGTLVTIAKDVKIQLDFNPQLVSAYRLIGYENRVMQNQDFRNDAKDAGEIGAGHTVTAFYEVIPAGVESPLVAETKSEFVENKTRKDNDSNTWLAVNLRYKQPDEDKASEFQVRLQDKSVPFDKADADLQFASAVAGFGLLLRDSRYAGDLNWDWVVDTAAANCGKDANGLRGEFVQIAKTARRIAPDRKNATGSEGAE